jgi:hypothetical protein
MPRDDRYERPQRLTAMRRSLCIVIQQVSRSVVGSGRYEDNQILAEGRLRLPAPWHWYGAAGRPAGHNGPVRPGYCWRVDAVRAPRE